jgi:hypothetical protein
MVAEANRTSLSSASYFWEHLEPAWHTADRLILLGLAYHNAKYASFGYAGNVQTSDVAKSLPISLIDLHNIHSLKKSCLRREWHFGDEFSALTKNV